MSRPMTDPVERFWKHVSKTESCWLWSGAKLKSGYGAFNRGSAVVVTAHRFSFEMANGQIPDGICVLHRCDVKTCVRPDHLFLGTKADNIKDMYAKGRGNPPRGERSPSAKLTEDQVRTIRADCRSPRKIAKQFDVARSTIRNIKKYRKWAHVS